MKYLKQTQVAGFLVYLYNISKPEKKTKSKLLNCNSQFSFKSFTFIRIKIAINVIIAITKILMLN